MEGKERTAGFNLLNTNLHSWGSDDIKGADHAVDEVDDFEEALLSDTPGAVDEEHHICFGTFANWEKRKQVNKEL